MILCGQATFQERRELARELITTIRGVDITGYRRIPSQEEIATFVKKYLPQRFLHDYAQLPESDYIGWVTEELARWLEYNHTSR